MSRRQAYYWNVEISYACGFHGVKVIAFTQKMAAKKVAEYNEGIPHKVTKITKGEQYYGWIK